MTKAEIYYLVSKCDLNGIPLNPKKVSILLCNNPFMEIGKVYFINEWGFDSFALILDKNVDISEFLRKTK